MDIKTGKFYYWDKDEGTLTLDTITYTPINPNKIDTVMSVPADTAEVQIY